jgi:hypothetical protein
MPKMAMSFHAGRQSRQMPGQMWSISRTAGRRAEQSTLLLDRRSQSRVFVKANERSHHRLCLPTSLAKVELWLNQTQNTIDFTASSTV